jgi:hypothetical protein
MPFPEQVQQFLSFIGLLRIRYALSNLESPKKNVRSNPPISLNSPERIVPLAPPSGSKVAETASKSPSGAIQR